MSFNKAVILKKKSCSVFSMNVFHESEVFTENSSKKWEKSYWYNAQSHFSSKL